MCSVLGVFDPRPVADLTALRAQALERSALQRHRGPDWSGVHVDPHAVLVHERLAIVDPAGGAQPLYSADGGLVLAVNGELYNHKMLEGGLEKGYTFQTKSDCEVINALYREAAGREGDAGAAAITKALQRINGIFAFTLWDVARQRFISRAMRSACARCTGDTMRRGARGWPRR